ncbi:type II toxin-antitoxin system ParD family antitoxin [Methylopila sp. M107]|uniref:ribbon-helix-helix domain-containing protein n=1 Tax=Methylopila sp. M107 TaxID=1101190 RepID=UPI00037B1CA2|nr:type II toxin-antitoxin system ParD family antitoxin [Methylopila sp. M107]
MSGVEKVSVALTPEMLATVRQAVDTGEYGSASEVMREAMREWMLRRVQRREAVAQIGRLWDEGLASGPPVDGEEAFARVRAGLDRSIASGGS